MKQKLDTQHKLYDHVIRNHHHCTSPPPYHHHPHLHQHLSRHQENWRSKEEIGITRHTMLIIITFNIDILILISILNIISILIIVSIPNIKSKSEQLCTTPAPHPQLPSPAAKIWPHSTQFWLGFLGSSILSYFLFMGTPCSQS